MIGALLSDEGVGWHMHVILWLRPAQQVVAVVHYADTITNARFNSNKLPRCFVHSCIRAATSITQPLMLLCS